MKLNDKSEFIQHGKYIFGYRECCKGHLGFFESFCIDTETQEVITKQFHSKQKAIESADYLHKKKIREDEIYERNFL
jgi:hypothetical protein